MSTSNLIFAQASPLSIGGSSLFDAKRIDAKNVKDYHSEKKIIQAAVRKLKSTGFQVFVSGKTTLTIAGSKALFEKTFGQKLKKEEVEYRGHQGKKYTHAQWLAPNASMEGMMDTQKSPLSNVIEGIALAEPAIYFENPYAPVKSYWHLRVPGDISLAVNADQAHRKGFTGKNVKVTMVDTGWYKHPYFEQRAYNFGPVLLGPGASIPLKDENGHGTAESANIFAIAPDCKFNMVKMGNDPTADFNLAANQLAKPDIISCSWGYSIQNGPLSAYLLTLEAAVANAYNNKIIVIFSAGNGHYGFPGQHPNVISAGGVFLNDQQKLFASNYASGFQSTIYPNRKVPDVCGLVGMKPRAAYIMLPLPAKCEIDVSLAAGGPHPNSDETVGNDGWAAISGTSAAAPQLAGVCALLRQKKSNITPDLARKALKATAIDVTAGSCNISTGGHAAGPGHDLATGAGLVNAWKAVNSI